MNGVFLSLLLSVAAPQSAEPTITEKIASISQKIEQIDVLLKQPKVQNMFDLGTGRSAYEILTEEKANLIEQKNELQTKLIYGDDADKVIALEKKIESLKQTLKTSATWLRRIQDLEGRTGYEAIQAELDEAEKALEEIQAQHSVAAAN